MMDLKKLIAEVKPEDMDKLAEIMPLLKKKANLDRLIEQALGCKDPEAKPKDEAVSPAPAAPQTKPAKRSSRRKRASAKKVETVAAEKAPVKAVVKAPATQAAPNASKKPASPNPRDRKLGQPTITALAVAFLKGKKQASIADIIKAVAEGRKVKVTEATENSIQASIYRCKGLKKVAPGIFALA